MPNAYEELRERLSRTPLPTELPFSKVDRAYREMGYIRSQPRKGSSHYQYRKPGMKRVTVSVDGKKVGKAAVAELAAIIRGTGQ